jgi:phage shock protein C
LVYNLLSEILMAKKVLRRNTRNQMIAGVCAGFADYFDLEVIWVRLGVVALGILTGGFPIVPAYIAAIIIIPKEGE